ncbi:MAG: hypothetical protein Q9M28_08265 [Mariprofundaceae bacterium]|nr:hypothetical protein [Mariprofundaceae bacterium]
MDYAILQNKSGHFIKPSRLSFQAAASHVRWQDTMHKITLTDMLGDDVWPITGVTFILMQKAQLDSQKTKALLDFFKWCYNEGDQWAEYLDYVPIPSVVFEDIVQSSWLTLYDGTYGQQLWIPSDEETTN